MFLGVIKHKPRDGAMPPPGLSPLGALREEDEHRWHLGRGGQRTAADSGDVGWCQQVIQLLVELPRCSRCCPKPCQGTGAGPLHPGCLGSFGEFKELLMLNNLQTNYIRASGRQSPASVSVTPLTPPPAPVFLCAAGRPAIQRSQWSTLLAKV